MDNFESGNLGDPNLDKPIPFDDSGPSGPGVSHAPLNLGGGSAVQKPPTAAPRPAAKPTASSVSAAKPAQKTSDTGRIQGVKTFFTKLHPGAISFLDEQITRWLQENPNVAVKRTNITTGEVQSKKTEPNILITVWY